MSEIKHYIYPQIGVKHYGEAIDSKEGFDVIDFESIKKLIEKLRSEIVESTGTFPMEFFLLSGGNYVGMMN